jgi:hypothetical protein
MPRDASTDLFLWKERIEPNRIASLDSFTHIHLSTCGLTHVRSIRWAGRDGVRKWMNTDRKYIYIYIYTSRGRREKCTRERLMRARGFGTKKSHGEVS